MSSQRFIEAVIFDLDDTLIDWSGQSMSWQEFSAPRTENVRQFLLSKGYWMPPEAEFFDTIDGAIRDLWDRARQTLVIQSIGDMLLEVIVGMGQEISALNLRRLLSEYNWGPFPGVVLFEDSLAVLESLQKRSYKIGLITNSFLPMWMRDIELEAYGILNFMDARVTAADVGFIKPHPEIYHHVLALLGTTADKSVFVGDRPKHDIAGANEAGLISVLYSPPHAHYEMDGVIPTYTISTLSQLIPLLERMN